MIRVYLTPLDDLGGFSSEIEITNYVDLSSIGSVKRSLDNSTYDIGLLRYNNLTLKLHNASGKFSDVESLTSVFRYSRSGSKVRVTWAPGPTLVCGMFICGEAILSEEVDIYRGILNDDTAKMNANDQIVSFQVLSYESQISKVLVPFDELETGDWLSDVLYKTLNQAPITRYAAVVEADINLHVDYEIDDIAWFENKTGKEAVEKILQVSNSILYFDETGFKASGREPSESVAMHFYGQASLIGNENIVDIREFRDGRNRVINHVRWGDEGAAAQGPFSIDKWGVYTKELSADFITDPAKQLVSAEAIVEEFENPQKEFELVGLLGADTIGLKFKDRIDIDYPTVVVPASLQLPVVGVAKIGAIETPLPGVLWEFQLTQEENFKIMEIEMDLKKELISFGLRRISL